MPALGSSELVKEYFYLFLCILLYSYEMLDSYNTVYLKEFFNYDKIKMVKNLIEILYEINNEEKEGKL